MKRRIDYFDGLKFVLCYIVMLAHYALAVLINAVLYAAATHLLSIAFYHGFEKPSIRLADWVYGCCARK